MAQIENGEFEMQSPITFSSSSSDENVIEEYESKIFDLLKTKNEELINRLDCYKDIKCKKSITLSHPKHKTILIYSKKQMKLSINATPSCMVIPKNEIVVKNENEKNIFINIFLPTDESLYELILYRILYLIVCDITNIKTTHTYSYNNFLKLLGSLDLPNVLGIKLKDETLKQCFFEKNDDKDIINEITDIYNENETQNISRK